MATSTKYKQFLKVSMEIPTDLTAVFRALEDKIQRTVVKEAVRSAIVPMRTALKAELAALDTPQTSGASLRALNTKVVRSKKTPSMYWGMVGVRKEYMELVFPEESSKLEVLPKALGIRQISMGSLYRDKFGVIRERRRPGRKEVQSKLRTKGGPKKRIPRQYWHLMLYGFGPNFKKGSKIGQTRRPFAGHRFLEKVQNATRNEVRQIFVTRFRELMKRVT